MVKVRSLESVLCSRYLYVLRMWVIPCEINTKNGHMSQISLKLRAHIVYLEE